MAKSTDAIMCLALSIHVRDFKHFLLVYSLIKINIKEIHTRYGEMTLGSTHFIEQVRVRLLPDLIVSVGFVSLFKFYFIIFELYFCLLVFFPVS